MTDPVEKSAPPATAADIHVVVSYADHQTGFFPVPRGQGWKVNTAMRCLVIGTGVPRTYVPLDGVQCFSIEERRTRSPSPAEGQS